MEWKFQTNDVPPSTKIHFFYSFSFTNRLLHEKREAVDAIELLKLFAKHRGISIDVQHHNLTSTITTQPATYDDNETRSTQETNATDSHDGTMSANI